MSPWKVILATMVIFVCGIVTGVLVIKTQERTHEVPVVSITNTPPGMPGPAPVYGFIRRLGPLNLTSNQHDGIVKIMQDSQATNASIRKTIAPLLAKEMDRAYGEIERLLTPEQLPIWAELRKERVREAGERGRSGHPGDGPGRRNGTNHSNGFPMDDHFRGSRLGGSNNSSPSNNPATNEP